VSLRAQPRSRRPPPYKRRRLEALPTSAQAEVLLSMVGDGRAHVAAVHAVARAHVADHGASSAPAMRALASAGATGTSPQNLERDLHRWLRDLGQLGLRCDSVVIQAVLDGQAEPGPVAVPCLAPHVVIAGILKSGILQTAVSLTGPGGVAGLRRWWEQALSQPWCADLVPLLAHRDLGKCVPLLFHEDGAEMYRNAEFYVWSWRSGSPRLSRGRGARGGPSQALARRSMSTGGDMLAGFPQEAACGDRVGEASSRPVV
jgi:hypothetical protein